MRNFAPVLGACCNWQPVGLPIHRSGFKSRRLHHSLICRKSGLYALSGNSLYKSTNKGKTWTELSGFEGTPGILSASEQLMLVTVGSDIYTSKNDGRKFKIVS